MSGEKFSFEELKVYQKSIDFINLTYTITSGFPKEENYRLTSQFIRFLRIALGSLKECVVCSTIAKNQNFINEKEYQIMRKDLSELSKMRIGLIKYLRNNTKD